MIITGKYNDTAQLLDRGRKTIKEIQNIMKLIANIRTKLKPQFT
jgi:hypothetical protein